MLFLCTMHCTIFLEMATNLIHRKIVIKNGKLKWRTVKARPVKRESTVYAESFC